MLNIIIQYINIRKIHKQLIKKYKDFDRKSLKILAILINELGNFKLYSEVKKSSYHLSYEIKYNNNLFNFSILKDTKFTSIKDNISYYHIDKEKVYKTNHCMSLKEAKKEIQDIISYIKQTER